MSRIITVARRAAPIARDGMGVAGFWLIIDGVRAWSVPAGSILTGLMLLAGAIAWARRA